MLKNWVTQFSSGLFDSISWQGRQRSSHLTQMLHRTPHIHLMVFKLSILWQRVSQMHFRNSGRWSKFCLLLFSFSMLIRSFVIVYIKLTWYLFMEVLLCWCKYNLKLNTFDLNTKSFHISEFSDDPSFVRVRVSLSQVVTFGTLDLSLYRPPYLFPSPIFNFVLLSPKHCFWLWPFMHDF